MKATTTPLAKTWPPSSQAELQLVPARLVRQYVPETSLWRLERSGDLPAVRIGRRRYYRLSDWEKFLNRCAQRGPLSVPWAKQNRAAQ